jgi:PAS domain S-box-containing protein
MKQPMQVPSKNAVIKESEPGLMELGVVINLLSEPAVVLDYENNEVLLPNSELLRLTAFSKNELIGNEIAKLFPESFPENAVYGGEFPIVVKRRNRESTKMIANSLSLNADSHFLLIRLKNIPEINKEEVIKPDELALELLDLGYISEGETLQSALEKFLGISKQMLQLDSVAIYQAEASFPQLTRIVDVGEVFHFPDSVSSTDLIRLAAPVEWVPGRRVVTDIHRFSRMNNLGYVISAPIGKDSAYLGLVVAGTKDKIPEKDYLPVLEKLAQVITNIFQYYLLVNNLFDENHEQQKLLSLRESLLNNSKEGILILNQDFRITAVNTAAEEMLGYANREIIDQAVENVLIGPTGLLHALAAAKEGIPTHDIGNELLHRRNGQAFPVNLQVIPVLPGKELQGILVFINDISEHEQIQVRTQQLEQRAFLGELMQVFAHEVRNPINNISTGLQVLGELHKEDSTSQTVITNAQNDCTRLIHLMESILAFSKQVEQKYEPMDIGLLLQRLLDRWRPRLMNANVEPFYQAEPDLPKVSGDKRSLEQVFINLFTNATEAMSETGGTLAIKIRKNFDITSQPQIEISVSDTGPGISDEMRARLFEPFATTKARGTGLGLAITRQIINSHKGSINVSTFPGGTVFHVYLPAIPTPSGEA